MDEKELNKKLDLSISKALEATGKKASKDFEVVRDAKLTQNMGPVLEGDAQKIQYEYANAEIYAKLQKEVFKGLKTNEQTEPILKQLIHVRYFRVIHEKENEELKTKGKEVMKLHNYGNKILAACTETLKKLLKVNLQLENLDLPDAVRKSRKNEMIQITKKYNELSNKLVKCVSTEACMLEIQPNAGHVRPCGWELT